MFQENLNLIRIVLSNKHFSWVVCLISNNTFLTHDKCRKKINGGNLSKTTCRCSSGVAGEKWVWFQWMELEIFLSQVPFIINLMSVTEKALMWPLTENIPGSNPQRPDTDWAVTCWGYLPQVLQVLAATCQCLLTLTVKIR